MNNIASLRKEKGMTQVDLAKLIGISQSALSQYEADKRTPDSKTLIKMAEIFQCTPNKVLGIPEDKSISVDVSKLSMTDVTSIAEVSDFQQANVSLRLGWRLLQICERFERFENGTGHSDIVYILGWYGDPANAEIPKSPKSEPRKWLGEDW